MEVFNVFAIADIIQVAIIVYNVQVLAYNAIQPHIAHNV